MLPEDRVRIVHMIEMADTLAGFVAGRERADLEEDRALFFAIVRAVEIFGEAASKVSAPTRASIETLPWRDIVATRNRLVHAYFDIDADTVWTAAIEEIPLLLPELRKLVGTEE